jgi:alanine racemase
MKEKIDLEKEVLRTWVAVDTAALAKNIRMIRKTLPKAVRLFAVVKSNAYGHDLVEWSKAVEREGVEQCGVDSLVEGSALRKAGVNMRILVLGYTLLGLLPRARKEDIAITLSSVEQFAALAKLPRGVRPLRVHVKVDTGMHRQGFQLHELPEVLLFLNTELPRKRFVVEGLYTHFAKAKNPRDTDVFLRQVREFERWRDAFRAEGFSFIAHASATGGALLFPKAHYDMVRVGAGMYGIWPSGETERARGKDIVLHPALSWRAMVSEVKRVSAGERIGYDHTELLRRDTLVAIIPIGYWHGYPRALSGRGRVLLHGRTARVLGRVSMNMITVDVTDIPHVCVGDVATVIGTDGKERISAEEIATLSGSTAYEILTRLNPLMRRFYE